LALGLLCQELLVLLHVGLGYLQYLLLLHRHQLLELRHLLYLRVYL
jgi:hypothetical protein